MKTINQVSSAVAIAIAFLPLSNQSAQAARLASGTFSLFLECNNDGTSMLLNPQMGWQYSQDAIGDMTDGYTYDMTGMAVFQNESDVFVALAGNMPLSGAGYDRSLDRIFYGDLFFTPDGDNFQNSMTAGNLYGIHFSGSQDSGANAGLGIYQNVAAKTVGMQNFGHRTYGNYEGMVDTSSPNFYGDLGVSNNYLNPNGPGYNVISRGNRVQNDGFQMLSVLQLANAGFNLNQFGGSEIFGFKFNLDAILPELPPPLPKDVEALKGIGEEYGYNWNEKGHDEQLAHHDQVMVEKQAAADTHQSEADAQGQQADVHQTQSQMYEERRQTSNSEASRLWSEEINVRNNEVTQLARSSSGGQGNGIIATERNRRNNIVNQITQVTRTLTEIPGQIQTQTQLRQTAISQFNAVPASASALATARQNASGTIQQAYAAVEDLSVRKATWEQYKQANQWDSRTREEQLALQEAYSGDWIAIRNDGSAAKDEQELTLFSQRISNFENQVTQQRQNTIQGYQTQISQADSQISSLQQQLQTAQERKPQLDNQLEQFYQTNTLRNRLQSIQQQASQNLGALDSNSSLTASQKAERREFYESEIARTQEFINELNSGDWKTSLDTLFDNAWSYFNSVLRQDARNSDRPIFDANGNPATYSQSDVTVQIPLYDEDGNITGYRTEIIGEVGAPKTVGSEYRREEAEAALFSTVRQERRQARNQAQGDRNRENNLKQQAASRQTQALSQKNSALSEKSAENERKNALLLDIEGQISQVRDTAIAEARRETMQESLAQANNENQREQALEDRVGARTPDNPGGIPNSEAEALSAMSVPEPSSVLGLMAITGACAALRRRRRAV